MVPQKPGNSPGSGPEVVKRQKVRSWTMQNEIRDVLGRVSTSAAGRILDSANPREIRILSPLQRRPERTQQTQVLGGNRGNLCVKILGRDSPRKDKSGYERSKEGDYKGLWRAQVALPVRPAHQSHRSQGETSVRGPIAVR